jgi:hypothetical protein
MNYRNEKYNENGTIDCEIDHPAYGWIPCTVSSDDAETVGIFNLAKATAIAYIPPPPPTQEELEEQARQEKVSEAAAYLAYTDWIVTKIAEIQLAGGDVEALKVKYATELSERKLMRELI